MDDAKGTLAWLDWAELRAGVHRRNAVVSAGETVKALLEGYGFRICGVRQITPDVSVLSAVRRS